MRLSVTPFGVLVLLCILAALAVAAAIVNAEPRGKSAAPYSPRGANTFPLLYAQRAPSGVTTAATSGNM